MNKVSDGSVVATYTYYYDGLRKSKTVNGVTTNYNWDAAGNLVRESDSNGNSTVYYYDINGNAVGFKKNDTTYYYHTNLHGDIISITDESGNSVAQYNYNPWGTQTAYTGTVTQSLRYAGYYLDSETGMYYVKARYYSPTLGRFLTRDGYGKNIDYKDPQTLDLYAYCNDNPVSFLDSSGRKTVSIGLAGSIGFGIGATGSISVALDDRGNCIKMFTVGGGGTTPQLALGIPVTATNAETVFYLLEAGVETGGTIGYISPEYLAGWGDSYQGVSDTIGIGIPVEVHGYMTWTYKIPMFNWERNMWKSILSDFLNKSISSGGYAIEEGMPGGLDTMPGGRFIA